MILVLIIFIGLMGLFDIAGVQGSIWVVPSMSLMRCIICLLGISFINHFLMEVAKGVVFSCCGCYVGVILWVFLLLVLSCWWMLICWLLDCFSSFPFACNLWRFFFRLVATVSLASGLGLRIFLLLLLAFFFSFNCLIFLFYCFILLEFHCIRQILIFYSQIQPITFVLSFDHLDSNLYFDLGTSKMLSNK